MGDSSNRPVELVAIINSFNRKALLERALLSLTEALCHAPFGAATVVFEAGSSDGSREFLEEWQRRNPSNSLLVITAPTKRASFSDGVNLGCSTALARFPSCRWLLLYETDNFLAEINPISEAISLLEKEPGLAAAGFTVKRHNGSFAGYGIRFPSWLSLALGQPLAARLNLHQPNDTPWRVIEGIRWRLCDIIFTSPLVIRREAWEKIGGFNADEFPFSDSDLDWAWRCREAGWRMAVISSESVVHDNLQQSSPGAPRRVIDFHRSRLRLLQGHRNPRRASFVRPLLFLRHFLEATLLTLQSSSNASAKEKLEKRKEMLRTVWKDYS